MISDLKESISIAKTAGVRDDQIILDPGVGFGKTAANNVEAIQHLDQLTNMGYPVLLATSRKGFIGQIVDAPPTERMEGTAATVYA
ncbi:dihydropteroate synthase, partial [Pseudomonas syringae pv. tagetis]|uniref:dihydropteroate synthase n=1 Tax=Pseudomonas syringae group genomosp. 7 TaxID=251699 RepID=UPI00376F6173